ncbi:MAG: arginine N-succinyltransferase [Desulfobacterales bacterium]|nr:arginine N-succinyltransferase [Desulfobacterales bacterium]
MQVLAMVLASMFIAIVATAFVIKIFLFPGPFKPVVLTDKEEQQLSTKLALFEGFSGKGEPEAESTEDEYEKDGSLKPEKYTEAGVSREINFTERELNAMVAKNTDLAEKLAIDLAENMVSIKLLIPLDPDFPMLGGRTLKIKAGAEFGYHSQRPVIKLKGVSLMGVPMPNAWLGGIKNLDLVSEFGGDDGFWKTFGDGVESISVVEGFLKIQLKE